MSTSATQTIFIEPNKVKILKEGGSLVIEKVTTLLKSVAVTFHRRYNEGEKKQKVKLQLLPYGSRPDEAGIIAKSDIQLNKISMSDHGTDHRLWYKML